LHPRALGLALEELFANPDALLHPGNKDNQRAAGFDLMRAGFDLERAAVRKAGFFCCSDDQKARKIP
jgi:hypothetical protein